MKKTLFFIIIAIIFVNVINAQDTLFVKNADDANAWAGRTAYTNLQSAIDAAVAGDQIWVAAGTYVPTATFPAGNDARCKSFVLKSDVSLYGGFAGTESDLNERSVGADGTWDFVNATILSGDISNTPDNAADNAYHVVYGISTSDVTLDGFTISGGYGNRNAYQAEQKGAGIYMGTNSVLRNCIILNNTALMQGGGAWVPYTSTIENCKFASNAVTAITSGGGAVYFDNCTYALDVAKHCLFIDNTCASTATPSNQHNGGGAVSCGNNCKFSYCNFYNNSSVNAAGAVFCGSGNAFEKCVFIGNHAANGGAIHGAQSSSALFSNCLITNNEASSSGGAINITGSGCRAVNCTFANNVAATSSVINAGAGFTLFNSILWNNGDANNLFTSNIVCKYNAVEGLLASGEGNLNVSTADIAFNGAYATAGIPATDEEWAAARSADYTIFGASLCHDAGNTSTLFLSGYVFPETDLNLQPRINGGLIDLGCYEVQCAEDTLACTVSVIDTVFNDTLPGIADITIEITISDYDATQTYTLTVGDVDVSHEMENGTYTFTFQAPDTIAYEIVRTDPTTGCSATIADVYTVFQDSVFAPVGITENAWCNVTVFPNPASEIVSAQCPANYALGQAQWQLFDMSGKLILSQSVTTETTQLDIANCKAGIYFLRLSNNGNTVSNTKIIKN